jgi:hypothetical protein
MLCTDGLMASLSEARVRDKLSERRGLKTTSRNLVDAALKEGTQSVTVLLAHYRIPAR